KVTQGSVAAMIRLLIRRLMSCLKPTPGERQQDQTKTHMSCSVPRSLFGSPEAQHAHNSSEQAPLAIFRHPSQMLIEERGKHRPDCLNENHPREPQGLANGIPRPQTSLSATNKTTTELGAAPAMELPQRSLEENTPALPKTASASPKSP